MYKAGVWIGGKINDQVFLTKNGPLEVDINSTFEEINKSTEAILNLKKSLLINSENAYAWYLLSRAYAQTGSISLANYATAERYFLIGERELSYEFAVKALKQIEKNSPEWYRSNDLIEILQFKHFLLSPLNKKFPLLSYIASIIIGSTLFPPFAKVA